MNLKGCGKRHRAQPKRISIQALIKATLRFNLASESEAKIQNREWAKYRRKKLLDLRGIPLGNQAPISK